MIHTILLDLDNTIYDFDEAERRALIAALDASGVAWDEEALRRYTVINAAQWRLLEEGKITRDRLKIRRFRLFLEERGSEADPAEVAAVYEEHLGIGHYFIDGAEAMLETLAKDYRLALITNGLAKVQRGRIASGNIARFFDGIFISQLVGYDKPDPRYFDAVLEALGNPPKDTCLILGDSPTSDILGGIRSGIRTVRYNPKGEANPPGMEPDEEIGALGDFPALVARLNAR